MKQFSGEDIVEARGLYKEQDKFTITGKLIMMCNKLPPVNAMDRGTWRRIRVIEFISKFLPPKEYEDAIRQKKTNVFPQDTMLDKKLESWREPFLALLVKIFEEEYIPFGLNPVPAAVMAASEKYKKDHDVFANFMSERVRRPITNEEKMECQEHPVALGRIRLVLSAWKKEVKCDISPQDVINRLVEEFGEPDSRGWDCFILFESADQARDWDEEHLPAAP
jgi:phage/plasmid-associated DNA primase